MIRRISKNNDYRDIIRSCPTGVIDDIHTIKYFISGHPETEIEATFEKKGNVLEVILPSSQLKTLGNGILMRRALYSEADPVFPDGEYNLEFVDDLNVWLGGDDSNHPYDPYDLSLYLLKSNVSGDTQMIFQPELPSIYLQGSTTAGRFTTTLLPGKIMLNYPSQSVVVLSDVMALNTTTYSGLEASHKGAGVYFDIELGQRHPFGGQYTIGITSGDDYALMIGIDNIYLLESGSITTIPFSELKDFATKSWVQEQLDRLN